MSYNLWIHTLDCRFSLLFFTVLKKVSAKRAWLLGRPWLGTSYPPGQVVATCLVGLCSLVLTQEEPDGPSDLGPSIAIKNTVYRLVYKQQKFISHSSGG